MRYILLKDAKPGMRLAHDIYDPDGRILVGSDCEITEPYIEKLEEYGFNGIYILDALSEDILVEGVITPELRVESQACVRQKNVDECYKVAKLIVEEIMKREERTLDLADLRAFDNYTYAHSVNVAVISCVIGMGLEMDETELTHVVMAALLHDLGKLSIAPEILNKPGRLTQEEYQVMKSHPRLSYELIRDREDISENVKKAVLFHHENVDGSGYPEGIDGSEQSLFTKILHVADVYDALVSKRPYKEPYSPLEACEYLMGGCGIMFDREIVQKTLDYVPLFPKGTEIKLSDGREGIIYENSGFHNLRPIIRLMDGALLDLVESPNLNLTIVAERERKDYMAESEQARREMIQPIGKYRIMVVDDMNTNRQIVKGILENLYEVILIESGEQALMYLEKNKYPDLILMDIDMPQMNGVETTRRIQEMTKEQIPFMFVMSDEDKEIAMECKELNPFGYILRPYKPVFVKSEVSRILMRR